MTAPDDRPPDVLIVAAYVFDRAGQYAQSSGIAAALYEIAAQIRDGDVMCEAIDELDWLRNANADLRCERDMGADWITRLTEERDALRAELDTTKRERDHWRWQAGIPTCIHASGVEPGCASCLGTQLLNARAELADHKQRLERAMFVVETAIKWARAWNGISEHELDGELFNAVELYEREAK